MQTRRSGIEAFLVIAVASALTVAMTYPVAFRIGSVGRIDSGDGQWSIWVINWVAHSLLADPLRVFDANIFFPHHGTLAYSETNLVNGALAAPVYWATNNPYLTHNFLLLLSFVLAFASTYYLARYLTRSRPAAAVAGVIFAFCPYVFVHTAHIHLLMTAGLPLSLLAFHRLADAPTAGRAVALGLVLALTGLSCGYYGVYAALVVSLASAYYLVSRRYWKNGRYYLALAAAALVAVALLYPPLKQYGDLGEGNRPVRELKDQYLYSANWPAYLASPGLGHRWMLAFLEPWSDAVFPGFTTLLLAGSCAVLSLKWWRASLEERASQLLSRNLSPNTLETVGFYGLATLVMFWLSWGPKAGLYSVVFHVFPYFSLLRAPVRLGVLVVAGLAILASVAVAALVADRRRPWVWAGALALLVMMECTPGPLVRFRTVPPHPAVYQTLATLPRGAVVEMPFFSDRREYHRHTYYMRLSTQHWMPLVNGYSDHLPPDFAETAVAVQHFPTREAFAALQARAPRYVVFHLDLYDARSKEEVLQRIAQFRDYLRPLASDPETRLYEITGWPPAH